MKVTVIPPCVTCGGQIDLAIRASRARVVAMLHPGHPHDPPKVCSACLWKWIGVAAGSSTDGKPTLSLVRSQETQK